jgi:hypothetical protein
MKKKLRTKVDWMPGMQFIFLSYDRHVEQDEAKTLCERYFDTHKSATLPNEALEVDLSPAYEIPITGVSRPRFAPVPRE